MTTSATLGISPLSGVLGNLTDERIAQILLNAHLTSERALRDARHVRDAGAGMASLLAVLLRTGAVPEQATFDLLSRAIGVPLWPRERLQVEFPGFNKDCALLGLNPTWCRDQRVAFLTHQEPPPANEPSTGVITDAAVHWTVVLTGAPSQLLKEYLSQQVFFNVPTTTVVLATPSDFAACHDQAKAVETNVVGNIDLQHLKELAEEGPVIELVNSMLSRAVSVRASDIHLEPGERDFATRLRVDGSMRDLERYTSVPYEAVVCRIKILASMDIAERRLPQDGRLDARVNGISFDVRVSIIPMVRGESVVLRLLRQERIPANLGDLGMAMHDSDLLRRWLGMPNGLILVTGPTGSGKSTTLYTAIDLLGKRTDKIVTVEDPVEYKLPGVSQIQVNADIGLDFPQALRSILRHDPDVILVGEIRDGTTAQIATQAALTGHLVLSTLHTNTAAGAVTRLIDMGVDSFLLADSLKGVMAQRLVRQLCANCKRFDESPSIALNKRLHLLAMDQAQIRPMQAVGCLQCAGSGYSGRLGIYDLISFDNALATLVRPGVTARDIETAVHQPRGSMPWADAWLKVATGLTTAEEILSSTSDMLGSPP